MALVSVVLPVYNREKVLARAIESVLAQTFTDWDMVIVDDGSKDNSAAIAEEYAARDPRIRVVRFEKNKGANEARNTGVRESNGKWIAMIDSDDEWLPHRLQSQFAELEKWKQEGKEEPGWVYGWVEIRWLNGTKSIDRRGGDGPCYVRLLKEPFGWTAVLLIRRDIFEKTGGFDARYWENCDEYDLALRASQLTPFAAVRDVICIIHRSPDSKFDPAAYARVIRRNRPEIKKHYRRGEIGQIYCGLAGSFYACKRFGTGLFYYLICLSYSPRSKVAWQRLRMYPKLQLQQWMTKAKRATLTLDDVDAQTRASESHDGVLR